MSTADVSRPENRPAVELRSPPSPVDEELSQAKARVGVCIFAFLYVFGWWLFTGSVSRPVVLALAAYSVFSVGWLLMVRAAPGRFPWRRGVTIVGDVGINSLVMYTLQEKGAFFYPMYLWIVVGYGVRYGPRYLFAAMSVGLACFVPVLVLSPYWRANAVAGSGLVTGLIVLPLFYLKLIRNLHDANARLTREAAKSKAAAQAKTEFLANMSHELRTPMNGVLGVTDLMLAGEVSEDQRRHLGLIQRSANALLGIIDDILEISRIEAGKITLRTTTMDLEKVVADVFDLLKPSAVEKGIELQLEVADSMPRSLAGDPVRIRQILFNLVGNAVKFTERGRVLLELESETLADGRVAVRCRVIDTGIGIPEDRLEHIFDKFEQADARVSRRFGGSGLGLAISRHLARLMGGDIEAFSTDRGTTFLLTLILDTETEPEDREPAAPRAMLPGEIRRALVVEDNPVNQVVMAGYLENLGLSTLVVGDGESALVALSREPFDVVFMDVRLPGLDGFETTRRYRAQEPAGQHLPIVAVTANAFPEDGAASLAAGMDLHLAKPIRPGDLERALGALHRGD